MQTNTDNVTSQQVTNLEFPSRSPSAPSSQKRKVIHSTDQATSLTPSSSSLSSPSITSKQNIFLGDNLHRNNVSSKSWTSQLSRSLQSENESSSDEDEADINTGKRDFSLNQLKSYLKKTRGLERYMTLMEMARPLPIINHMGDMPDEDSEDQRVQDAVDFGKMYKDELDIIVDDITNLIAAKATATDPTRQNCDKVIQAAVSVTKEFLSTTENNSSEKQKDKIIITSPRRNTIRQDVRKGIQHSADKMKHKYAKKKRIEIMDFSVGKNVTIQIPKEDRNSTDNKRLECTIINKKESSAVPTYRLICKYGILDRWVTASHLLSYACGVYMPEDVLQSKETVSLGKAARLSSLSDRVLFCKCRAQCKSNICKCKKASVFCGSRCNKGAPCANKGTAQAFSKTVNELFQPNQNKKSQDEDKPSSPQSQKGAFVVPAAQIKNTSAQVESNQSPQPRQKPLVLPVYRSAEPL